MALRIVMAAIVLVAAGCAGLPVADTLEIGGQPYRVQWTQAPGRADVLLVLEPGFARRCSNLRTTARRLAEVGALVLCLDAPMAAGNLCWPMPSPAGLPAACATSKAVKCHRVWWWAGYRPEPPSLCDWVPD